MEKKNFPVLAEFPVQWGEMDAAGHVNNLIYLKWFEAARCDYFTALEQEVVFNEKGPGFILASQECKYLFPLRYPDTVVVGVKTGEMGQDRFNMHCRIWSKKHDRLVAIANAVIVTYDYHQQSKVSVPADLRDRISRLEGME